MARPAHTYRGNNASKVSGRGRFTRLRLAAERNASPVPVVSKSLLVDDKIDVHFDEVATDNAPVVETVEETPTERKNRLARERRAAKKLADQEAAAMMAA